MSSSGMLIIAENSYAKITKSSYYIGLHHVSGENLRSVAFLPTYIPVNTVLRFYSTSINPTQNRFFIDWEFPGYTSGSLDKFRQYFISNYPYNLNANFLYLFPLV